MGPPGSGQSAKIQNMRIAAAVILVLSMAQPWRIVNAALRAERPSPIDGLILGLLSGGMDTVFPDDLAPLIGLPQRTPTKRQVVERSGTEDGSLRFADLSLDISRPPSRPTAIYLVAKKSDKKTRANETLILRLSLKGVLEKGVIQRSVPGKAPGKAEKLDPKAPEAARMVKRELDFWLKGVGRKL